MSNLTPEMNQFLLGLPQQDGEALRNRLTPIPSSTLKRGEDYACYAGLAGGSCLTGLILFSHSFRGCDPVLKGIASTIAPIIDGGMIGLKLEKMNNLVAKQLHRRDVTNFLRSELGYRE